MRFQVWAVDANGQGVHAGAHEFRRFGQKTAERYVREWEAWADGIAAEHPDCPTAQSRGITVAVIAWPIGKPELRRQFTIAPIHTNAKRLINAAA